MSCEYITGADGKVVAIVCSRGGKKKPKRCSVCKNADGDRLCDASVSGGGMCSAPMCVACTFSPREGVDYCPRHRRAPASSASTPATSSARPKASAGGLEKEFSWSKSAGEKFDQCARQYWLHYHGSWGGWDARAPERARKLYILKNLSSRPSWAGSVVHEAVKRAVFAELENWPTPVDGIVEDTLTRMQSDFAQSRRKTYRSIKKGFGLIEHELDVDVPGQWWQETREQVERCIRNALRSGAYGRAICAEKVHRVDSLDSFPFVADVKTYAGPDLAFDRCDGRLELVDWKTGRAREADSNQLALYAAFAVAKLGAKIERCVGTLVYLDELDELSFDLTAADLELAKSKALDSIMRIQALGPDDEEQWPKTENLKTCRYCNFRRECGRENAR